MSIGCARVQFQLRCAKNSAPHVSGGVSASSCAKVVEIDWIVCIESRRFFEEELYEEQESQNQSAFLGLQCSLDRHKVVLVFGADLLCREDSDASDRGGLEM